VAPEVRSAVTVVANGKNWSTTVTGSTNAYFLTNNWTLAAGRTFSDEEQSAGAAVCVIGATVQRELFGASSNPLGEQLRVKSFSCQIVGLLAAKGRPPWASTRTTRSSCRCAPPSAASPAAPRSTPC
jgi:putative ABC transport system permease protein